MKIAPYNPALGPNPELTPKARAKGRATMPAVIPPNKSPLKCLNMVWVLICSLNIAIL
jgi:hypothetical protein